MSTGLYHTMALTTSGTMYAWGQNGYGQIGNGSTNNAKTAVAVSFSAGTVVTAIPSDSSSSHSLAIAIPAPANTATTLSPSAPSPTYGQAETLTATVTGSDSGGTVAFSDGSNTISGCGAVRARGIGAVVPGPVHDVLVERRRPQPDRGVLGRRQRQRQHLFAVGPHRGPGAAHHHGLVVGGHLRHRRAGGDGVVLGLRER